jgi:hypothetical protein
MSSVLMLCLNDFGGILHCAAPQTHENQANRRVRGPTRAMLCYRLVKPTCVAREILNEKLGARRKRLLMFKQCKTRKTRKCEECTSNFGPSKKRQDALA